MIKINLGCFFDGASQGTLPLGGVGGILYLNDQEVFCISVIINKHVLYLNDQEVFCISMIINDYARFQFIDSIKEKRPPRNLLLIPTNEEIFIGTHVHHRRFQVSEDSALSF